MENGKIPCSSGSASVFVANAICSASDGGSSGLVMMIIISSQTCITNLTHVKD